MNRETQVWNNAKSIVADKSTSDELKEIANRILSQQGVKATEVDQVFEWTAVGAGKFSAKSKAPEPATATA